MMWILEAFSDLVTVLDGQEDWSEGALEASFKGLLEKHGVGMGKLAQPVRIAITGTSISPGIFEVLHLLGKEKSMPRLKIGLTRLQERIAAAQVAQ